MVQKYNSLRILLTGSNGMLGSNYLSLSSNLFDVIPTSSTNKSFAYLDLTDSNNVKSVLNTYMPNIIINCSAITDVDGAELDKKKAYDVNVNGIRNIIKYSDVDTKIIHISSDYVFNGLSGNYSEKSRPDPINYYGKTKLESENILVSSNRKYLLFRVNGLFSFDII